jgi:hypothetical protein
LFSQVNTNNILNLSEIDQDYPLLDNASFQYYSKFDLNKLLTISEKNGKKIDVLFNSLYYYLNKDTCLSFDVKQNLFKSIDTLKQTFFEFIEATCKIEYLSYGKGHQAGYRTLIFRIIFQDKFYEYLKYWASSYYSVYLEK